MKRTGTLLMLCAWLATSSLAGAALQTDARSYTWRDGIFALPLEIRDNSGVERRGWPVTTGVPLPYGLIQEPGQLRLTDEKGREIPAQMSALSRNGARDVSLRWVLLHFQADVPANGTTRVILRNDRPAQPLPEGIRVTRSGDSVVVDTGPLRAVIDAAGGRLFREVAIDGRVVLRAKPGDGPRLRSGEVPQFERFQGSAWNTHGWNKQRSIEARFVAEADYAAGDRPLRSVEIEEAGPLRTVIALRGRYWPQGSGAGMREEGFYNFTTRLHFYRGKSYVKVEHSIDNSDRTPPLWNLMFREATLRHTLELAPGAKVTAGGLDGSGSLRSTSRALSDDADLTLRQEEAEVTTKYGKRQARPSGFRFRGTDGGTVLEGERARFLDVSDGDKGLAVALRYWWQEAPRGVRAAGNRIELQLQADSPGRTDPPDGKRVAYDLDFGERNLHDSLYYFHSGSPESARVAEVAEAFEYPLFAYAGPEWYADSGQWYFEISPEPSPPPRGASPDEHWQPDSAGIKGYGYNRSYNSGGNHDSLNSGWLPFMRSGALNELERNLAWSRWSIAHNPGLAYLDNVLRFGEDNRRYSALDEQLEAWNDLTAFGPKDFYLWRSGETYVEETRRGPVERRVGGWSYLNRYKYLPDHEHYALFRLFEYYYLTGDRRALDAINGFVNWDLNFQQRHLFRGAMKPLSATGLFADDPDALRRGHYARVYTWMLYTNLAGFNATGSPVMDEFARWQIRRLLALLRHRRGQLTSWKNTPGKVLGLLPQALQEKIANRVDLDLLRQDGEVLESRAQSWMEAQGVMALHEAYKTFGDERILDGLWAQADYFANHVLYFPRLGMFNNRTSMPNSWLGGGKDGGLTPQRHGRYFQALPILYHYTGWPEIERRYRNMEEMAEGFWYPDWYKQAGLWERSVVAKRSSRPPATITDLRVEKSDRNGITLTWTSPQDDGPRGRAARYFVKISDKPIVEFAPKDHPARADAKARAVREAEEQILASRKGKKRNIWSYRVKGRGITPEAQRGSRAHPRWGEVNAFWMAEHVSGEPAPAPAGTKERFTVREITPNAYFGLKEALDVTALPAGSYYLAVAAWDDDRNLSRLSNVVRVELP